MISASHLLLLGYLAALATFSIFGLYKLVLLTLYIKNRKTVPQPSGRFVEMPRVTIQLPIFNELYVVKRLITAACSLDYPKSKLEIQVLDDSTDETVEVTRALVRDLQAKGIDISHYHRKDRKDFKAGALANGLSKARGEFLAIFDADFVPQKDFLAKTIHFFCDPKVGMVQARWVFLNTAHSLLTRIQTVFLNGHFIIEHTSRHRSGNFFNFNGTAGIWRKSAIDSAGGWQGDTLTEDLDLSYRAQLTGWKFVYLKDVLVPSELPVEIGGFKGQQFRWVKGMTEVGIKLLPRIWQSPVAFHKKLDATFHLLSNTGYITTTIMAMLVIPTLLAFDHFFKSWTLPVAAYFLATNFFAIFAYFYFSETQAGKSSWRRIPEVFMLMVVGIGLSINGTKAMLEAVVGHKTQFIRTPKYSQTGNNRVRKRYFGKYFTRFDSTFVLEILASLYFLVCGYFIYRSKNPYFLMPLFFFGIGYLYLILQTIRSKWLIRKSHLLPENAVAPIS